MKFDVVIGNPPYKQGLHLEFLEKAIEISDVYVAFIQPATWVLNEKNSDRNTIQKKLSIEIEKYNLKIELHNGLSLFKNASVGTYIGIFLINKKEKMTLIKVDDKTTGNIHHFKNINEISKYGNSNTYISLKKKIIDATKENNLEDNKNNNDGNFYVNMAEVRGHINDDPNKMWNDDFYTIIPKDIKVENKKTKKVAISFRTEKEAINFLKYLKTDFARFALSIYKNNIATFGAVGQMRSVPYLDFTQEWTDEKLDDHFNLTQDEVDFIKKHIPEYY